MEDDLDKIAARDAERVPWLTNFYFGDGAGLKPMVDSAMDDIDAAAVNSIRLGDDARRPAGRGARRQVRPVPAEGRRERPVDPARPSRPTNSPSSAPSSCSTRRRSDRELGADPATGLTVFAKNGKYGPYVQLGEIEVDAKGKAKNKPKTASLFQTMTLERLTLEDALQLLSLPREVGADPADGEMITAQNGRYGPYLTKGNDSRSLENEEQIFTITLDEAIAIYSQPKQWGRRGAPKPPLATFGNDPISGRPMVVKDGRFGPYVTDGETNATIPAGVALETLTEERAIELLAEKRAKGPAPKKAGAKRRREHGQEEGAGEEGTSQEVDRLVFWSWLSSRDRPKPRVFCRSSRSGGSGRPRWCPVSATGSGWSPSPRWPNACRRAPAKAQSHWSCRRGCCPASSSARSPASCSTASTGARSCWSATPAGRSSSRSCRSSNIGGLFFASLFLEVLSIGWSSAKESTVPNLVPKAQLPSANSASVAAAYGTFPLGSLAFALLAALSASLGHIHALHSLRVNKESLALWADGFTFLASFFLVRSITFPPTQRIHAEDGAESNVLRDLREGWKFIGTNPRVRSVLLGLAAGLFGGGMLVPLGATFAKTDLGGGDAGFGALISALGFGVAISVIGLSLIQSPAQARAGLRRLAVRRRRVHLARRDVVVDDARRVVGRRARVVRRRRLRPRVHDHPDQRRRRVAGPHLRHALRHDPRRRLAVVHGGADHEPLAALARSHARLPPVWGAPGAVGRGRDHQPRRCGLVVVAARSVLPRDRHPASNATT